MPFSLKLEKRLGESRAIGLLVPVGSLLLALVFGAVLLALAGANPWQTYRAMLEGAFGTPEQWQAGDFYALTETLVKATPLMLCGLAVSIAFRMLFWNIGAEGQLVMGGFAAGAVALWLPGLTPWLPSWAFLPLMGSGGHRGRRRCGAWCPDLLKAYLRVNEIITTLMLNYIAILWVQHLYYGPWKDPQGFGFPGTAQFEPFTWLPRLTGARASGADPRHPGGCLHLGGAGAHPVGLRNPPDRREPDRGALRRHQHRAQHRAGDVPLGRPGRAGRHGRGGRHLAPAAAGAGGRLRLHRHHRGLAGPGSTRGAYSWSASCWPALLVGGDQIQITMGLPASVALVLQGAILFCMLGGNILTTYRVRLVRNVTALTRPAVVPGSRTGRE